MLRASNQAVRRIGTHYIFPTCVVGTRSAFVSGLRPPASATHHVQNASRLLSGTATRSAPTTAETPPDCADANIVSLVKTGGKKKKKKKSTPTPAKTVPKPATKTAKSATETAAPKKTALKRVNKAASAPGNKTDARRQLEVLQGALVALKKVLATENIDIGDVAGLKSDSAPGEAKTTSSKKAKKQKAASTVSTGQPGKSEAASTDSAKQDGVPPPPEGLKNKKEKPLGRKTNAKSTDGISLGELRRMLAGDSKALAVPKEMRIDRDLQEDLAEDPTLSLPLAVAHSLRSQGELEIRELGSENPSVEAAKGVFPPTTQGVKGGRKAFAKATAKVKTKTKTVKKAVSRSRTKLAHDMLEGGENAPSTTPIDVKRLYSHDLNLVPIVKPQPAVPSVSYGLDRVLFNPGVYHLQDPRSRVYNFDPYLSKIMPIKEFDFNALKQYVTSSKDETLIATAREHGKKYTGSTSSMTSMLSHFHFLLSSWRPINSEMVSQGFPVESEQYTAIMRAPAATFLHWKDGVYAIDADKEYDSSNILSMLGKSMEKLLTMTKEEYERYRHVNSDQISEEERNADEAFHYTGLGDFMMRSQLDAHDPRVPGTGMFDLKTRAVISIRMDAKGFQKGLGYEIRQRFGQWESFEREYHDMIRSAFLKYSLQVRMGRMDGIFVAFHNTQRIFGFQYIPLEEMDLSLHGTSNVLLGDKEFKLSLGLLNELLDRATNKFPEQSLRLHFETRQSEKTPFMYFFAKPVAPGEIEAVQNAGKASIDAFETEVLGLGKSPATTGATPESEDVLDIEDAEDAEDSGPSEIQDMEDVATWEEVRAMVDEAMEADEVGVGAVREAIEIALDESGLLESQSIENTRRYVDALLSAITGNEVSDEPQPSEDNSVAQPSELGQDEDMADKNTSLPDSSNEDGVINAVEARNDPCDESESLADATSGDSVETENSGPSESHPEGDSTSNPPINQGALYRSAQSPLGETEQGLEDESALEPLQMQDEQIPKSDDVSLQEANDEQSQESQKITLAASDTEVANDVGISTSESASTPASSQEEIEAEDEEEAEESNGDNNPNASMMTLRNLIKRMAQKVDVGKPSAAQREADDSSRLKEFERILRNMITQSKAEDAARDIEDANDEELAELTEEKASCKSKEARDSELDGSLLGMVLTIRNTVNGEYVTRPNELGEHDDWAVEYNIDEMDAKRTRRLYEMCKTRRQKIFSSSGDRDVQWHQMWKGQLSMSTQKGRTFREQETMEAKTKPVYVVGEEGAKTYEEVFGADEVVELEAVTTSGQGKIETSEQEEVDTAEQEMEKKGGDDVKT